MKKGTKIFLIIVLVSWLFIGCSSEDALEQPEIPVENLTEEEIETMCEKTWNEVDRLIGEKYLSSSSPSELKPYFGAIKKMDYVEDVICTETSVVILLKNGNAWSWMVKDDMPAENIEDDDETDKLYTTSNAAYSSLSSTAGNVVSQSSILNHISRRPDGEKLKILIFDQTTLDEMEWFQSAGKRLQALKKALEDKGAEVTFKTTNYAIDDLDEYDLCLLHTHGEYIFGQHSILTSVYASTSSIIFSDNWTVIKEMRHGKFTRQRYYTLTSKDIKSKYRGKLKKRGTFLFVTACHSLEGNYEFAKAFINCGASGYIGYTDVIAASKCTMAAQSFFLSLLNDSTISEAYTGIPYEYTYMKSYLDDDTKEIKTCNTQLEYEFASNEVKSYCYGHVCPAGEHPHLIDMGNGTKWSCCNIGASNPYSAGNYYSWGETSTKSQYSRDDNKEYSTGGYSYGNSIACTSHDVAWVTSNGKLRMPSYSEFRSLISNCDVTWVDYGSHGGAILTSKLNGNKLYISAGGWNFDGTKYGRGETCILWTANRLSGYMAYFMQVLYNGGNPHAEIASSQWSGHNVRGIAVSELND